ncbi:MAG: D-aminoacyl-tRNA deacylase [Candidatus Micrarchaeales archaeon]
MIGLISSALDPASKNMTEHLVSEYNFEEVEMFGRKCWKDVDLVLCMLDGPLVHAEFVDSWGFGVIYFLSKHKSNNGIPSLTTHSLGNWGVGAKIGGKPHELSCAAPYQMLSVLNRINMMDASGVEKTYEATHHGPLLKTPSLFVELGGDDATINNPELAKRLADALYVAIPEGKAITPEKVAIGIGGMHYPRKFTQLALEKGYAFSHIMPKHAITNQDGSDNLAMLDQAAQKSKDTPNLAVIEWKSINAPTKDRVIKKLNELGLEYERA